MPCRDLLSAWISKLTHTRSGRPIASQFLTLPPRDELPDYYEFTKLPIAIDTIEDRIHDGGYNSVTEIESDFKRMVQNAKDYNSTGSEIYEDAERIRKLVYNYMKSHNPAYTENPNYASFPTPIPKPGEKKTNGATESHGTNGRTSATPARNAKTKASSPLDPPERKPSVAVDAANGDAEHESGVNFTGLSFQDAQFAILDALLKTTDEEYVSRDSCLQCETNADTVTGDWRSSHHSRTCLHESLRITTNTSSTLSHSRRCESVWMVSMAATNILESPTSNPGTPSKRR
jgi:hypothetical protein